MAEVIPQLDEQVDPGPRDAVGHFLFAWSQLSALGGAVLLFGACALSVSPASKSRSRCVGRISSGITRS